MEVPWTEMTVRDFQSALASSSPTPGGGTAAAIALGQSAALVVMVCDLTLGKEKWKDGWSICEEALPFAVNAMTVSGELASDDSSAFDKVMDSFKLPKTTDDEISFRRKSIRESTLLAAEVPFKTAKLALELLKFMPELAQKGNNNAISDVGVAGLLASAACKGALFNVDINLNSLPDDMGVEIRNSIETVRDECRTISRKIMDDVRDNL